MSYHVTHGTLVSKIIIMALKGSPVGLRSIFYYFADHGEREWIEALLRQRRVTEDGTERAEVYREWAALC